MIPKINKYLFLIIIIGLNNLIVAINPFVTYSRFPPLNKNPFFSSNKNAKDPLMRTRVAIAPLISFYTVNQNHAQNPSQKMSVLFSIKEEIRLNEKHTAFLLIGLEYMAHGLNFNSYYFKPDSLHLYDGNMNYNYSLYIHEIDIPVQIKYSFTRENNSLVSPYVMIGYHFRTILQGTLQVKLNGDEIENRYEKVVFKNPLFNPENNAFMSVTCGVQKNNPKHPKRCVFGELSYRYGFSPYIISDNFTPSSLFMNGSHLAICLGFKF